MTSKAILGPEVTDRSAPAFWSWLFQRITGTGLFFLIFAHMWINHYADPETTIQVATIEANLKEVGFVIFDSLLLIFCLFHGLNGVRNVVYDYLNQDRHRRLVTLGLLVMGAFLLLYGMAILFTVTGWL